MPYDSQGNWIPGNPVPGGGSGNYWENPGFGYGNQGLPDFGASADWDGAAFGDAFGGGEYGQYGDSAFDNFYGVTPPILADTTTNTDSTGGSKTRTAEQWKSMGSGLSSVAAGLGDVIGAKGRIDTQKKYRKRSKGDIDKFYADFEAGKYDATMSPEMLKYFSMGRRRTDITPTLSAQATSLDYASQDPRTLAASLPGMTGQYSKSMQDIARKDFETELGMAGVEGQAYQGLAQGNLQFMRDVYGQKLTQDQAAYAQAQQNIEQIKANRAAGWGNIIGGGLEAGVAYFGEDGMKIPKFQGGGDVMQQILASQGQGEGGVPARQDLPGEESHEANPISMVAENGEVVGEATGGEIILNSEQTKEIENAVAVVDQAIEAGGEPSMEDLMAVYEAVSDTLSQPQFDDESQQTSPQVDPAQENMMAFLGGGEQMA